MRKRSLVTLAWVAVIVLALGAGAVALSGAFEDEPDIDSAKRFERFPIYWPGEEFEGREVTSVTAEDGSPTVVLIYGTCEPRGGSEPSCVPPLEIQIFRLCSHLDAVALPPAERRRRIRGAPVGTQDGAPVLLTRRTQIKVYRGEGSDAGMPRRALKALRSLNAEAPVISATDPIPAPLPGVLEKEKSCSP